MHATIDLGAADPGADDLGAGVGNGADVSPRQLAADLYALVVYLHKNFAGDLLAAMGALDLTITQTKLLQRLEHADRELTVKDAAQVLALSLPAASRAIDDLARRGLVGRHEDTDDRRMKRIALTELGRSMIRRLNAARLTDLEQFVATLDDSERAALATTLKQLLRRSGVATCRPEATTRA